MENTSIQPETEPQVKIVKASEVEGVLVQLFDALSSANATLTQCRAFIQLNLENLKAEQPTEETPNV